MKCFRRFVSYIFLISIVTFGGCFPNEDLFEKIISPQINVLNEEDHFEIYTGDTIFINYEFTGLNLDSICLSSEDSVLSVVTRSKDSIMFIGKEAQYLELDLKAYFNGKLLNKSQPFRINVYNLIYPKLRLECVSLCGEGPYYLGDSLLLTVRSVYNNNLGGYISASMFFNEDSLGSINSEPFSFKVDSTNLNINNIRFILTDDHYRTYEYHFPLNLELNQKPEIGVSSFNSSKNLNATTDTKEAFINASGSDDYRIDSVQYFLDDSLVKTVEINSHHFSNKKVVLNPLSPGFHNYFCIAYDHRGLTTKTEVKEIVVYKTIAIQDTFIDIVKSLDKNRLFAITNSSLFYIDVTTMDVSQYELPFDNATAVSYDDKNNLAFVGSENGEFVTFNSLQRNFGTVLGGLFTDIQDLVVDDNLGVLIVISNRKVALLDLSTTQIRNSNIEVDKYSTLALNKKKNIVYAGGTQGLSSSLVYKISYSEYWLSELNYRDIGGNCLRLLLNTNSNRLVPLRGFNSRHFDYDATTLKEVNQYADGSYTTSGNYNTTGDKYYAGVNIDNQISVFSTETGEVTGFIPMPIDVYDHLTFIISNFNDSYLIAITDNHFRKNNTLFFIPLKQE